MADGHTPEDKMFPDYVFHLPDGAILTGIAMLVDEIVSRPAFVGTVEMHINHDTVKSAIAYWLNECVFQDDVRVTDFNYIEEEDAFAVSFASNQVKVAGKFSPE